MKKTNNIINELKELKAEHLANHLENRNDIPADYFTNLSTEVFQKIEKPSITKKRFSITKIVLPISIAASFIILFILPKNTNDQLNWNLYSSLDYKNYIEQNIGDFTIEELTSTSSLGNVSIFTNSDISNVDLEDYLIEEDFDEDELF